MVLSDRKTGLRTIWLAPPACAVLAAQSHQTNCPWVLYLRRDGKPRRITLDKPDAVQAYQASAAGLAFLAHQEGGDQALPLLASGPTLTRFMGEYVE